MICVLSNNISLWIRNIFVFIYFLIWLDRRLLIQNSVTVHLNMSIHAERVLQMRYACISELSRLMIFILLISGTLPLPPPMLPPPPPPPPIEDIPQRSPPIGQIRRKSFGPSTRGNYAELDGIAVRHTNYSEGEGSDFEPHYLVQTSSGNVFVPPSEFIFLLCRCFDDFLFEFGLLCMRSFFLACCHIIC